MVGLPTVPPGAALGVSVSYQPGTKVSGPVRSYPRISSAATVKFGKWSGVIVSPRDTKRTLA